MPNGAWSALILIGILLALSVPGMIAFYLIEVRTPRTHGNDLDALCSCGCQSCAAADTHKAAAHKDRGY
jgi:hypothetical protein